MLKLCGKNEKELIAPLDDEGDDDADDDDIADTEMASHSFAIVFRSFVYTGDWNFKTQVNICTLPQILREISAESFDEIFAEKECKYRCIQCFHDFFL